MAETYLTPTFQNAVKPQAPPTPGAPASAPAPAKTGGEQYQTPTFQNAVKPPAPTTGGGQQAPPPPGGQPSQSWGIDWSNPWSKGGPALTMPQSAQDWSTIAAQNSLMGLYPGLTAQAEAARKRLDPVTAASADVAGNIASPTTLLNAVPYVGPELAGAAHEGIKSAVENWKPSESLGEYATNVAEDAAGGAAAGLVGQGVSALSPGALSKLTRGGVVGGGTYLAHKMLGGLAGGDVYKEGAGLLGLAGGLDEMGKRIGEKVGSLAGTPAARQAIQNLILSGGSALRQGAGPWDQWVPGQ
jgi:hypothetical protein